MGKNVLKQSHVCAWIAAAARKMKGGLFVCAALAALGAWADAEKKIEVACVYYPHWHEYPKGNEW